MEVLLINTDNVVEMVLNVNSIDDVIPYYTDHLCIERTGDEWVGYQYTENGFIPPASAVNKSVTCITQYAFLNRFTDQEAVAIDLASQGTTVEAAMMRRVQKKIDAASYIDLADPTTRAGVQALEMYGLIASGRASEILDSPVQIKEHYVVGA